MNRRRHFLQNSALLGLSPWLNPTVRAAGGWPDRDIEIVVARKPGGGVDTISRLLAPLLERELNNVRIGVSSKPGASGAIAAKYIQSLAADGYHWLATGGFSKGLRAIGVDESVPWRDWQYYGADSSLMSISVPPDSPITDMEDLVRRARDEPEKLTMATSGLGGTWHLGALLVVRETGARFRFIPYQGGKAATVAGIQREVDVVCSGVHEQIGAIRAGDLRHLATGATETINLGGVELASVTSAVPGLADKTPIGGGMSIALRRDTDTEILEKLANAWMVATADPGFIEQEENIGRLVTPVVGEKADRRAAQQETISANLLSDMGLAKMGPEQLGLPAIADFDSWWPPAGYQPRFQTA